MRAAPEIVSPFGDPDEVGRAAAARLPVTCVLASTPEEREIHWEIRRRIFVEEQGFFEGTDRDVHDAEPGTSLVLGVCGRVAGGSVRLYPLEEPGRWKGDRLAVLPEFRRHSMGADLVRFAVRTAGERGGDLMVAHVQVRNVAFFEHLGWYRQGEPVAFHGHPHQVMAIDLTPFHRGG